MALPTTISYENIPSTGKEETVLTFSGFLASNYEGSIEGLLGQTMGLYVNDVLIREVVTVEGGSAPNGLGYFEFSEILSLGNNTVQVRYAGNADYEPANGVVRTVTVYSEEQERSRLLLLGVGAVAGMVLIGVFLAYRTK